MKYRTASVEKLINACRLFLSPDAPEHDDPFSTDFTQDDEALAQMRAALDELEGQIHKLAREKGVSDGRADPDSNLMTLLDFDGTTPAPLRVAAFLRHYAMMLRAGNQWDIRETIARACESAANLLGEAAVMRPHLDLPRPKIICLCGSTRFIETFAIRTWELEREGFIVLGCTLLPLSYCKVASHFGEATGTKAQCDALHLRKIDLADEVLVLNVGGYIGESTRNEIAYAESHGKPVKYLEALAAAQASPRSDQEPTR